MTGLALPDKYVVTSHQPQSNMLTIMSKQVTRPPNRHVRTNKSSARKGKSRPSWVSDDNAQGLHISHPSTPVEKTLVHSRMG
jgi:hypothetical protein